MARSYWVPKCKWCGKVDKLRIVDKEGPYPPIQDPEPSMNFGTLCSESPTRRHKLEWVRFR